MTRGQLTRRGFVAGLGAGALAAAGAGRAGAQEVPRDDDGLLNLALALEHLQAAFYSEAETRGALGETGLRAARALGGVERAHVAALTEALGAGAQPPPHFDFGGATRDDQSFVRTAVALEDLAAATQQHLLPLLATPGRRALLAAIRTVDAGHAAWLRLSTGVVPVAGGLDDPVNPAEAVRLLVRGGYALPRPGAGPGGPWAVDAGDGPDLLTAFPLGRRPPAAVSHAPGAGVEEPAPEAGPPWLPWIAVTGTLSTLVVGGIGLRARAAARRVTVVGPDEGPRVSQPAGTPDGVAQETAAAQTAGVHPAGAARERV